ncbi:MAG: family transcriptional regulator [Rhizobium sp.]|nr:family transcriptional regulator [Rhizobium sp.]
MRDIRPIRNDDDLAWALKEVDVYFDNPPPRGGEESDRFDVLADLIEAYEKKIMPIEPMEPIDLLKAHMENTNRTQGDLGKLFGSRQRASEVLRRRRALSKEMIYLLSSEWHIPADLLVAPYKLAA